ncbi:MAG: ATPase, partial [Actinobacteria bacterium]|nr:ATPase [Actinomycetota bacterium]
MTIQSRPRDTDRKTRVHLSVYDRTKFLMLFTLTFFVLAWASMADNPLLSFNDAIVKTADEKLWLLVLAGVEIVRQIHFILAELLAPYHGIWLKYFSFVNRLLGKLSDWNRFRLGRVIKWLIFVAMLSIILGAVYKETPIRALFLAPKALWSVLPMIGQLMFAVVFVIIQFAAIFWFLSRGGVDTYFPDDIRTRFSD